MTAHPHEKRHQLPRNTMREWSGGDFAFMRQACPPGFQRASGSPRSAKRSRKSVLWSRVAGRECPDRVSNRRTVGQGFHKGQARPFGQGQRAERSCRKGGCNGGKERRGSPLAKRVCDAGTDVRSESGAVLQTHGLPLTKNRLYVVGRWGCGLPVIARYASPDLTHEGQGWRV
jgi:hypothetical protein